MKRLDPLAATAVFCLSALALACGGSPPSSELVAPAPSKENPVPTPTSTPAADPMRSARSAAPSSISANATIMDWNLNVVSQGANEWTCLPDRPDTVGNDPWCVTEPWLGFLEAHRNGTDPTYTEIGFAYMMQGDTPVSNADPFAVEETGPEDWITDLGPHLMMVVPHRELLASMSTDHLNGGPWVMWADTPYAHIMIPLESRWPSRR